MNDQEHPITPSPELRDHWRREASRSYDGGVCHEQWFMARAAQWGADQELEACCEWLDDTDCEDPQEVAQRLRAARRPKPPSLKEQALEKLMNLEQGINPPSFNDYNTIRRALEQLND
jgi:hypothetical protein